MKFFDKLFRRKPAIELHDPVFGPIRYAEGLWAGPWDATAGHGLSIDAPESGPSARQRELFRAVRENLAGFVQRARDFIRTQTDEPLDVSGLSSYSIDIGNEDETSREQFDLELSDDEAAEIHIVTFRAGEPVAYGCDD